MQASSREAYLVAMLDIKFVPMKVFEQECLHDVTMVQ